MNQRWHSHNQHRGTTSNALISPRGESVTCSDSGKINCFWHCSPTPHKWALKVRSESCPAFHPSRCPCVNPGDKKSCWCCFRSGATCDVERKDLEESLQPSCLCLLSCGALYAWVRGKHSTSTRVKVNLIHSCEVIHWSRLQFFSLYCGDIFI